MPKVSMLYFAQLKDVLQRSQETFDLPAQTTSQAILDAVVAAHPEVAEACRASRVAVDQAFVEGDIELTDGIEVAIIPPVSGG